uniref:Globin family profile domain-containing protein n=1 Tax=Romanomermis culicivorax TaxID=13658 RepID=A0A915J7S9_ROMCU
MKSCRSNSLTRPLHDHQIVATGTCIAEDRRLSSNFVSNSLSALCSIRSSFSPRRSFFDDDQDDNFENRKGMTIVENRIKNMTIAELSKVDKCVLLQYKSTESLNRRGIRRQQTQVSPTPTENHRSGNSPKSNKAKGEHPLYRRSTFASERPMVLFNYNTEKSSTSNEDLARRSGSKKAKSNLKRMSTVYDHEYQEVPHSNSISRHGSIRIPTLTSAQLNLIRSHWKQTFAVKGPTVLGMHIFQRACFKCPTIHDVFKQLDSAAEKSPSSSSNVDTAYKNHATSIGLFIDEVVKGLDDLKSLDQKIYQTGMKHAPYFQYGLAAKFFDIFAEAFIDCTLEWGEKMRRVEEARKAWAITVAHVLDRMKAGFVDGKREMTRHAKML